MDSLQGCIFACDPSEGSFQGGFSGPPQIHELFKDREGLLCFIVDKYINIVMGS